MHKLKEKLLEALYEYEDKAERNADGKISDNEIQKIHIITDTVKNIDKISMLEGEDSSSYGSDWMGEGRIYGNSYNDGGSSYARGRGRYARRDSMGRYAYGDGSYRGGNNSNRGGSYGMPYYNDGYSREGKEDMARKLRDMMGDAQTEEEREALRACIRKIEEM